MDSVSEDRSSTGDSRLAPSDTDSSETKYFSMGGKYF